MKEIHPFGGAAVTAQERPRPTRAVQLGRRLVPVTVLVAVLLSAPWAYAGHWVAALIFAIAPLTWLGYVTLHVARMEKGTRPELWSPRPPAAG